MSDDPANILDEKPKRWPAQPRRLESAGAADRIRALQEGFRKTGVGKSRNKVSFRGLGRLAGPVALAGMLLVSLWIIVRDDGHKPSAGSRNAYYGRCDDARADGSAPMRLGEPGYRPGLDADGDGIGCEPIRMIY